LFFDWLNNKVDHDDFVDDEEDESNYESECEVVSEELVNIVNVELHLLAATTSTMGRVRTRAAANAVTATSSSTVEAAAATSPSSAAAAEREKEVAASHAAVAKGHAKYQKAIAKMNIKNMAGPKIGDLVLFAVDSIDRQKTSPNNLICYVMEENNGNYRLGCRAGVLNHWYHPAAFRRTQLKCQFTLADVAQKDPAAKPTKKNPDKNKYIKVGDTEYVLVSVREAIAAASLGLSQGT
jgi:hypothetical protein